MPFYLLTLDEYDTEELSFVLLQSPNGTPLCGAQAIRTPKLLGPLRIYWLEDEFATPDRIEKIGLLKGVKEFTPLHILNTDLSIYDNEWLWEDNYIQHVFANVID